MVTITLVMMFLKIIDVQLPYGGLLFTYCMCYNLLKSVIIFSNL